MAFLNKKISLYRVCLLLMFLLVTLLLLSLRFDVNVILEKYSVNKDFVDKISERPKHALLDTLLMELQESFHQIKQHSKTPKITKSKDFKCILTDEELEHHRCPSGIRTGCIQESMSNDPRHRLEDLMYNEHLKIAPQYREVLHDLERQIEGYYHLVIVSALSSNHYLESQAMLKDLHEKIFPIVPNITLVVYDIGLTAEENTEYQKFCKCKLLRFPFEKFPSFCSTLKCYCWKPLIVRAHLANGDMVMWMDASVRYTNPEGLLQALERTKMYGLQQNHVIAQPKMPVRSLPPMFHHYGFTPCVFKDYHNAASNWAIYRNSPLIEHAVLDIWAACGLNQTCTCPVPYSNCPTIYRGNRHFAALCHRSQTTVAIILAILWMEDYSTVAAIQDSFVLRRDQMLQYFQEIKTNKLQTEKSNITSVNPK